MLMESQSLVFSFVIYVLINILYFHFSINYYGTINIITKKYMYEFHIYNTRLMQMKTIFG